MATPTLKNLTLAAHTTLQVGGVAAMYAAVKNERALVRAVDEAIVQRLPLLVLGGGSNLLVADDQLNIFVLKMEIKGVNFVEVGVDVLVTVGAGEVLDEVIQECVARGYWGLENLSHIPGSVGATPIQNVGAYGVEVADMITLVRVYDQEANSFKTLSAVECQFAYRDSLFKSTAGAAYIVTAVTFKLTRQPTPKISYKDLAERFTETSLITLDEVRSAVIDIRSKKFPDWQVVGTAGSFFKNPVVSKAKAIDLHHRYPNLPTYPQTDGHIKISLGWLLDKVFHLKGVGTLTVGCYEGQALVIINRGKATAAEIKKFADEIKLKVKKELDIEIEYEVRMIGF